MRIAVLTNFLPPYRLPFFSALHEMCPDLEILISTRMEAARGWPVEWGDLPVTVQRTLTLRKTYRHGDLYAERAERHIPIDTMSHLRRLRPDVVVSGELGMRTLFAAFYRLIQSRSRLVIWATLSERTEITRGSAALRWFRRLLLLRADRLLVNGVSGRRYVEALGISPERISEMPYSIDHSHFEGPPHRPPEAARRILVVGQLNSRKGVHCWLEAVRAWAIDNPNRRLEIRIVGSGEEANQIAAFDGPENMDVSLLGAVSYDALPNVYRECGILAFPTLADEWGVVVNEAMVAGLPVLGSIHAQAVEELVTEGVSGWLFDPAQADECRAALDRAMTVSDEQLNAMRVSACQTMEAVRPEACARRFHAVCRAALKPAADERIAEGG